ncbi:MAG: hypothetical protein AAFV53_00745 [Myxococcota bacterium]
MSLFISVLSASALAATFTVTADDVSYNASAKTLYVSVSGVDAGTATAGVIYIHDAGDAGLLFDVLVGDYTTPKDDLLAFKVTEGLYAGAAGDATEATLSTAPVSDTEIIGVQLEASGTDAVPATNGEGLFASYGTSMWGPGVDGHIVQRRDGDVSFWYDDDLTQTTLMVGGAAHGICAGKGCTVASTAGDNYWGYYVDGTGVLYRFDIGEDCWYTFNGKRWVVAEEDPDDLWVANAGHNVWYFDDNASNEVRKVDYARGVWYTFDDGEWVADIGEDCWRTAGTVVSSAVRLTPISSADLKSL